VAVTRKKLCRPGVAHRANREMEFHVAEAKLLLEVA
jgi:hypothetical protein